MTRILPPPSPGELACPAPPRRQVLQGLSSRPGPASPRGAASGRPTARGRQARANLGFEPMAHERLFWDIALEHEDGVLVYREVIWTIGRQCGKTVALLLLMLWRCLRWPGQVVRYGAQTGMDARAMLADTWWPRLVGRPGRPGTPDLGLRAGRPAQQGLSPGETVHQAPFTALRALAAPPT